MLPGTGRKAALNVYPWVIGSFHRNVSSFWSWIDTNHLEQNMEFGSQPASFLELFRRFPSTAVIIACRDKAVALLGYRLIWFWFDSTWMIGWFTLFWCWFDSIGGSLICFLFGFHILIWIVWTFIWILVLHNFIFGFDFDWVRLDSVDLIGALVSCLLVWLVGSLVGWLIDLIMFSCCFNYVWLDSTCFDMTWLVDWIKDISLFWFHMIGLMGWLIGSWLLVLHLVCFGDLAVVRHRGGRNLHQPT